MSGVLLVRHAMIGAIIQGQAGSKYAIATHTDWHMWPPNPQITANRTQHPTWPVADFGLAKCQIEDAQRSSTAISRNPRWLVSWQLAS